MAWRAFNIEFDCPIANEWIESNYGDELDKICERLIEMYNAYEKFLCTDPLICKNAGAKPIQHNTYDVKMICKQRLKERISNIRHIESSYAENAAEEYENETESQKHYDAQVKFIKKILKPRKEKLKRELHEICADKSEQYKMDYKRNKRENELIKSQFIN